MADEKKVTLKEIMENDATGAKIYDVSVKEEDTETGKKYKAEMKISFHTEMDNISKNDIVEAFNERFADIEKLIIIPVEVLPVEEV